MKGPGNSMGEKVTTFLRKIYRWEKCHREKITGNNVVSHDELLTVKTYSSKYDVLIFNFHGFILI